MRCVAMICIRMHGNESNATSLLSPRDHTEAQKYSVSIISCLHIEHSKTLKKGNLTNLNYVQTKTKKTDLNPNSMGVGAG